MATIPGSAGLPLIGDKSYEFYKDPVKFVNKYMQQYKSRLFIARFLNKPTVFIGSNSAVHEILADSESCMDLGYKQFMEEIYGDNILFTDGDAAFNLRSALLQLFNEDSLKTYQDTVDKIVDKKLMQPNFEEQCCIYEVMKRLCTEICLSLFLDVDFENAEDMAKTIVNLTTTHWHGIISVPIAIKLPLTDGSTYNKALHAKEQLLKIIHCKKKAAEDKFPQKIQEIPHGGEEMFSNNHLLLFTSALVPKALSSLLTSFVIEVAQTQGDSDIQDRIQTDTELMNSYLLEVQRLYPPFLGGRRIMKEDVMVNGYKIPKGHAVLYVTYSAHRDPKAFTDPGDFKPERWNNSNANDQDKLLCFGSGPRGCIGQTLVWNIIQTVIKKLFQRFHIKLQEGQDLNRKMLPVSRPKNNVLAEFTPRIPH
ncbi:hypothetical protein KUTeg_005278 [Tegillarca granosa]|uniref:Cytochrome P450 n=1 Tax=Tegillarca granosa TaxID=220873 RepID=A0ABQ9FJC7_TEGGR|nr:hypothetical protein KUTeg_005278 [Tegillarca granosa]